MPRDGSGAYTLPVGNPVITGTLIESTWANSTLSDIAVQLNNVLTRDGVLGPVSPFKLVDGAVATPGLAFNSEPGLGWFRAGTSRISVAAVNAVVEDFNYSTAADVFKVLYPRTAGATSISLGRSVFGTADTSFLKLSHNSTESRIESSVAGSGTMGPIVHQATLHKFNLTDANSFAQFSRPAVDSARLTLNKHTTALSTVEILSTRNGVARWGLTLGDSTAESGFDVGSDFFLNRYTDAGVSTKTLTIRRNTGLYIFNSTFNGGLVVIDEGSLSESFRTSVLSPGGNPNSTTISGNFTYRALPTFGAVAGAKAQFYGDLDFPNTGTPGRLYLAPATPISWNTFYTSGTTRLLELFSSAPVGGFAFTTNARLTHNPGVSAAFQVIVGGLIFDMTSTGTGSSLGGWVATSDGRLKTKKERILDALEKIDQLSGWTFDREDMKGLDGVVPRKAGYIAQDVQKVLPEAVVTADDEMGTLSVDHNGVIGLLIEGVKELHARLDQLEA